LAVVVLPPLCQIFSLLVGSFVALLGVVVVDEVIVESAVAAFLILMVSPLAAMMISGTTPVAGFASSFSVASFALASFCCWVMNACVLLLSTVPRG
jgi:hypothetical protein